MLWLFLYCIPMQSKCKRGIYRSDALCPLVRSAIHIFWCQLIYKHYRVMPQHIVFITIQCYNFELSTNNFHISYSIGMNRNTEVYMCTSRSSPSPLFLSDCWTHTYLYFTITWFKQANALFPVGCICDNGCAIPWLVVFILVGGAVLISAVVVFIQGKYEEKKPFTLV